MMGKLASTKTLATVMAKSALYTGVKLRDSARLSGARLVEDQAQRCPHASALVFEDRHYSYRSFNSNCNRISNTLTSMGARAGDSIALLMDARPEALFTVVGANKVGVLTALVPSEVRNSELLQALRDAPPRWIIVGQEHLERLLEVQQQLTVEAHRVLVWSEGESPELPRGMRNLNRLLRTASEGNPASTRRQRAEDPMLCLYTSGTTGKPKATYMRNQRFLRLGFVFGRAVLRITPEDVGYLTLPLSNFTAIAAWAATLTTGGCLALSRTFDAAQFWHGCHRYGATWFPYRDTLCHQLLRKQADPSERDHQVRLAMGTGLKHDHWQAFHERFSLPRVVEWYGSTEGTVVLTNLDDTPGMLGQLLPGQVLARFHTESGELARNPEGQVERCQPGDLGVLLARLDRSQVFDGYLNNDLTKERILPDPFGDGHDYFDTRDVLQLHEERAVSFAHRLDDTFLWRGTRVAATEQT